MNRYTINIVVAIKCNIYGKLPRTTTTTTTMVAAATAVKKIVHRKTVLPSHYIIFSKKVLWLLMMMMRTTGNKILQQTNEKRNKFRIYIPTSTLNKVQNMYGGVKTSNWLWFSLTLIRFVINRKFMAIFNVNYFTSKCNTGKYIYKLCILWNNNSTEFIMYIKDLCTHTV